jgi:hypothetical protein
LEALFQQRREHRRGFGAAGLGATQTPGGADDLHLSLRRYLCTAHILLVSQM